MKVSSLTKLLEEYEISINAACMLRCLTKCGVLIDVQYHSTTGSGQIKSFKKIADCYQYFGVNKPTPHEFKTEVRFYSDRFLELLDVSVAQLNREMDQLRII